MENPPNTTKEQNDAKIAALEQRLNASKSADEALLEELVALGAPQERIDALREKMGLEKEEDEEFEYALETEAELKLAEARALYIAEYKKCNSAMKKQVLIARTKNTISNILTGVKNIRRKDKIKEKIFNEEDFFTEDFKKAKAEYDKARVALGDEMYYTKKAELENQGLSPNEVDMALAQYRSVEILSRIIVEERQKLIDAKAAGLPIKPAMWKRLINAYTSLEPRWKKVAVSTLLFLPIAVGTAGGASVIAAYGIAGLATVKFAKSMLTGTLTVYAGKAIDLWKAEDDYEFEDAQLDAKEDLKQRFGQGALTLEEYEKEFATLEAAEKKRARNRTLVKAGVGILLGGGINMILQGELSHLTHGSNVSTPKVNYFPDHSKINSAEIQNEIRLEKPIVTPDTTQFKADTTSADTNTVHQPDSIPKVEHPSDANHPNPVDKKTTVDTKEPVVEKKGVVEKVHGAFKNRLHKPEVKTTLPPGQNPLPAGDKGSPLPQGQNELPKTGTGDGLPPGQNPLPKPDGAPDNAQANINASELEDAYAEKMKALYGLPEGQQPLPIPDGTHADNLATGDATLKVTPDATTLKAQEVVSGDPTIKEIPYDNSDQTSMDNYGVDSAQAEKVLDAPKPFTVEQIKAPIETPENVIDIDHEGALRGVKEIRQSFNSNDVAIVRTSPEVYDGATYRQWNQLTDKAFNANKVKFESFAGYKRDRIFQQLFGHAQVVNEPARVDLDVATNKNITVPASTTVSLDYYGSAKEWPTVKAIPAKYFLNHEGIYNDPTHP